MACPKMLSTLLGSPGTDGNGCRLKQPGALLGDVPKLSPGVFARCPVGAGAEQVSLAKTFILPSSAVLTNMLETPIASSFQHDCVWSVLSRNQNRVVEFTVGAVFSHPAGRCRAEKKVNTVRKGLRQNM